jgi:hypothetical protein
MLLFYQTLLLAYQQNCHFLIITFEQGIFMKNYNNKKWNSILSENYKIFKRLCLFPESLRKLKFKNGQQKLKTSASSFFSSQK